MKRADPFAPGLLAELPEAPKKAAVLRASRIGDFLCAVPALRSLRAALPGTELILITLPMLRELALRLPCVDRVVGFPGYPGLAEQLFDPRRAAAFFQQMQAEELDLAIQMQGTGVYSNPFVLMLGGRRTAGFVRPGDGPGLLQAALPIPESGHEIERVLALAEFLGAPSQGKVVEIRLRPEDRAEAERLLRGAPAPWIGVHTGARDRTRRWPVQRFAQAGRRLQRQFGGSLVFLGDGGERARAEEAHRLAEVPALNLAGRMGLPALGALIERLSVLLTNDTGPAHLAYALGAPVVTIFGGADPARYGPPLPGPFEILVHPIACRPCPGDGCPIGFECLERIGVEQAVRAAGRLIQRTTQ